MKVIHVCAYAAQYGGNFLASLMALDAELSEKNVTVEYLFPKTAKNMNWCLDLQRIRTVYFAGTNRFSLRTVQEIRLAIQGADIIHSHFELYDCIVAVVSKRKQKVIWHLHDSFDDDLDILHRMLNRLQYGILGKNVFLISPSAFYADYVMKLGFPAEKVRIVPNCLELRRLHKDDTVIRKIDFLVYGGFYRIKGLDILLDAYRLLVAEGERYTIGVVGYEETWQYIQQNYRDLEPDIIKIAPTENVSKIYSCAKIFLSTSRRECFSYALAEALYLKMPAIVSNIPGTAWSCNYRSVRTFKSENPLELAEQMRNMMALQEWRSVDVLNETSDAIKETYPIQKWVDGIGAIYYGTEWRTHSGSDDLYSNI